MTSLIQIVDEDDQPVRSATKQEAWEKDLIHRCVRLVVRNKAGKMLLQHRTPIKDIFPNRWDTAAAGHVDAGEDYDTAMRREITEELGLQDLAFTPLGRFRANETIDGRHLNRFNQCYVAVMEQTPTYYEKDAIDGWQWFTLDGVRKMVRDHPDQVTDGLRQIIDHYYS